MTVHQRLQQALDAGEAGLAQLAAQSEDLANASPRDRAATLLTVYALRSGPVTPLSRWADHPAVAELRWRLEKLWLDELTHEPLPENTPPLLAEDDPDLPASVARSIRWLAARDRLPAVYKWVAEEADAAQVQRFLDLEGGPDAGFDDLVAAAQMGLSGEAKMELARNYWDEMGNGTPADVHTTVHRVMAEALGLSGLEPAERDAAGLQREALCSFLAANHWLQPELLGALGLIELQAGPRCRLVGKGLRRTGAPERALTFYDVHADVDPRHGRDWLDHAIEPTVREHPDWAARIVRGAWWRSLVNDRFFSTLEPHLAGV